MANDDGVTDDMYYDETICRVYDKNDFFTILVQILLGIAALMSLYVKRMQEVPKRTFKTWFLDVSKQGFGAVYAHVLNMIIAAMISQNIRGESELEDQCAWYGMSYLIDTTLGLVLSVIGLKILDHMAHERDWVHIKHSGVYTGQNGMFTWAVQVLAWLFILTIVKIIVYLFMWIFSGILAIFGAFLFEPMQNNKHFELVFVMIVFPGILNCIYFWIADGYLKAKKDAPGGAHEVEDEKSEALITAKDIAETEIVTNLYQPAPWSSLSNIKQDANFIEKSSEKQVVSV